MKKILFVVALFIISQSPAELYAQSADWRNIENALSEIPDENYCDQPYVVIAPNGDWVCTLTTGPGGESGSGQHIVASISRDKGKTWSSLINIEPGQKAPAAASWVIPYITDYGRIYAFYTFNGDNIVFKPHSTLLGWYCFKYSDDNGRTWSQRYRIPLRKTTVDYFNQWHGSVQNFWGISKPLTVKGNMYFSFSKILNGGSDEGITEGWLFKSDNINTEKDAGKLHWQLLPDGETGICTTELGPVQEEHNIVSLKNGDLFCVYRTATGFIGKSYSRDGGHTWSKPDFLRYPDGRVVKHPRACPRLFQSASGKFLLWFHNNNGIKSPHDFRFRNPAWILGGVEKDGNIQWSQPEILLYDLDTVAGMSYPDLIEENGRFWVTETQKRIARIHPVDKNLLEGVWNQFSAGGVVQNGLVLEKKNISGSLSLKAVKLPGLKDGGFSIELWFNLKELVAGQILLDSRNSEGKGIWIEVTPQKTLQLSISGGTNAKGDSLITDGWDTDPGAVQVGKLQHAVFTVDGAANIITCIVNGKFCDGGRYRNFGWSRINEKMDDVNGTTRFRLPDILSGQIRGIRIYDRYLTTSEAISNFHAGPQ